MTFIRWWSGKISPDWQRSTDKAELSRAELGLFPPGVVASSVMAKKPLPPSFSPGEKIPALAL